MKGILIDEHASQEWVSLHLTPNLQFTDDEFYEFCQANSDLRFERDKNGNIHIFMPTGGKTSDWNAELVTEISLWNRKKQEGKVLESNGAFRLPNKAIKAPDVSWTALSRWNTLTEEQKEKFPPLCPDFVIELMSKSDALTDAQDKMKEWIENGCRLGWLLDPANQKAYIYRPDREVETVHSFDYTLSGEEVLNGFELDLKILQ